MAETKISDLTLLSANELDATNDVFPIVDISADQTKSMKIAELEVGLYQGGDRNPSFNDVSAVDLTITNDISANGTGDIFSTLNSSIESNTNALTNLGNSFVTINDAQDIAAVKVFDENVGFNNHISIGQNGGADLESASIGNNSLAALEVHNVVGTTSIYASNDIVAFSDISVKDNIRPIPHAIQKVKRLNGRLYTRTDSEDQEKIHMGLIAQEVEQVIPEVVKDLPEGKKAVAYQNIIGLLIEAVKDQQKQIENLSKQIK
jgi:hypothetical protein